MSLILFLIALTLFVLFLVALINPASINRRVHSSFSRAKLSLSLLLGSLIVLVIFVSTLPPNNSRSNPQPTQNKSATGQDNEPKTDIDILKDAVNKSGIDTASGEGIRNIDVVPQESGGYGVFVEINAPKGLSSGLTKKEIEYAAGDIYLALYRANKGVKTGSVAAYLPLVDQYGNLQDVMVYKNIVKADKWAKINSGADNDTLKFVVFPGIWDVTIQNSKFVSN